MKHSLQLKLSQHLTLTPQLQQSIRLLQLSTLELNQEIERLLQENPLLEKLEEEEGAGPPVEFTATLSTASTTATTDAPAENGEDAPPDISDFGSSSGTDTDWGGSSGGNDDDDD